MDCKEIGLRMWTYMNWFRVRTVANSSENFYEISGFHARKGIYSLAQRLWFSQGGFWSVVFINCTVCSDWFSEQQKWWAAKSHGMPCYYSYRAKEAFLFPLFLMSFSAFGFITYLTHLRSWERNKSQHISALRHTKESASLSQTV